MVRTRGPALSLDAAGSIGDTVTFSHWKGRSYFKKRSVPSDPRSPGQVANRLFIAWLNDQWSELSTVQRATWSSLAEAAGIAPSSAFIAENVKRASRFVPPTKNWPTDETNTPPIVFLGIAPGVGAVHSFSWIIRYTHVNDAWSVACFLSTIDGFSPSISNLIDLRSIDDLATHTFIVTRVTPGDYFIRCRPATDDGVSGTFTTQAAFTVKDY